MANESPGSELGKYVGPWDVLASKEGTSIIVLAKDARQVVFMNRETGEITARVELPDVPNGFVLSPDGKKMYVACGIGSGSVQIIDVASRQITGEIAVGHTPGCMAISPDGKRLFVGNRFNNDVSVVDLSTGQTVSRVPVIREPMGMAITPDGSTVLVTNHLPLDPSDSYDVAAAVTLINTADLSTVHIRLPNGSTSMYGVCVSPDGRYAYAVHLLSRYQMPTTQLERGWMNTNALSILDVPNRKWVNTVLLDEVDLGAANPWAVACTPDGQFICVTHAGTHELSVIDAKALHEKLASIPADVEAARAAGRYDDRNLYSSAVQADIPNDLAFLVDVRRRIRLQGRGPWGWLGADYTEANGPRGMAIVGRKVYIAVYFSDKLAVVDLDAHPARELTLIPLGPKPELTIQRRGEMHFFDAWLCFQHWQSCASCHPDARVDGLNWDLMNDGLGTPKNTKSMLLSHATPPSMASGVRPTAEVAVRSGFIHIQFAVRPEQEMIAVDEYLKALKPVPSPYLVNGQLSESAQRGKELFFSERIGCYKCHPEPLYTDLKMHDVGSRGQYSGRDDFDTPSLIECWRTAPYMHDGRYTNMKDVFKIGKHGATMGAVESLTEEELNDLVEFMLSL